MYVAYSTSISDMTWPVPSLRFSSLGCISFLSPFSSPFLFQAKRSINGGAFRKWRVAAAAAAAAAANSRDPTRRVGRGPDTVFRRERKIQVKINRQGTAAIFLLLFFVPFLCAAAGGNGYCHAVDCPPYIFPISPLPALDETNGTTIR